MILYPSPNFNARDASVPLSLVLVHYTAMPCAQDALSRLCDPEAEVSAHYMIDRDGTLFSLVDEKERAWHAGQSFWYGQLDINSASLGIELVNDGAEVYPSQQIASLKNLLKDLFARYSFRPSALQGHSDVAPSRKMDPGVHFPWEELAAEGFGLWPCVREEDTGPALLGEREALLGAVGYEPSDDPLLLRSFHLHYRPKDVSGILDGETMALLRALRRQIEEQGCPAEYLQKRA